MSNLSLWDQVESTDPQFAKKQEFGAKLTAIDAQYQRKTATKMFGPMGIGWGTTKSKYTINPDHTHCYYSGILWYTWEDKKGTIEIGSDIKIKPDFIKCVRTDAITKGLSELGFNADVFMGTFDENKYVKNISVLSESGGGDIAEGTPELKGGKSPLVVGDIIPNILDGGSPNSPLPQNNSEGGVKLTFGMHNGTDIEDIPQSYLEWIAKQYNNPEFKFKDFIGHANAELQRRVGLATSEEPEYVF